ncbi:MAG: hypothetical protein NW224_03010 [Leptolyngbyaceae cyanobacterium bins.302]|nr:hypothetical protein [Leptolyngbyaceae cyanobacterium bins.302]
MTQLRYLVEQAASFMKMDLRLAHIPAIAIQLLQHHTPHLTHT